MPLGKRTKDRTKHPLDPHVKQELEVQAYGVQSMKQKGLPLPKKPKSDEPEWPDDISSAPDPLLGKLLGYYAAVVAWSHMHLAQLDVRRTMTHEAEKTEKLIQQLQAEGRTQKEREAEALTSEEVAARQLIHHKRMMEWKLANAIHQGLEAKYKAVSREISRRETQYVREHD